MKRARRERLRRISKTVLVAAGVAAAVAAAQTAVAMGSGGAPEAAAEKCTRFVSLSLAAEHGIRHGRVEQIANGRMTVTGRVRGGSLKITLENRPESCALIRTDRT